MRFGNRFLIVVFMISAYPVMASDTGSCPVVNGDEKLAAQRLESQRVQKNPVNSKKKANACKITLGAVTPLWKRGQAMLIDIRPAAEYQMYHIPNSVNMPLFSISSKPFLMNKNLILVNNGHVQGTMESVCSSLKGNGFNPHVLQGGLFEWIERGNPLTGNRSAALSRLRRLNAKEFQDSAAETTWVVINATQQGVQQIQQLLPQTRVIKLAEALKALQEGNFPANKGDQNQRLLMVTDKGNKYDLLSRPFLSKKIRGLFYLEGGLDAFLLYKRNHDAMLKREKRGPVKYTKCSLL